MTEKTADEPKNFPLAFAPLVERLERFPPALATMLAIATAEDARWRPAPDVWSIHDIVCHLADEEERDFRVRIGLLLDDPEKEWPKIDPDGWVVAHDYAAKDPAQTLKRFVHERRESVAWLRSLEAPDWSRGQRHPAGFTLAAGDLLASWAAHDALHIRQIGRRLHELAVRDGAGYDVRYAGELR